MSNNKEIGESEHAEILSRIVEDYILKGVTDPSKIAKGMKMKRGDVVTYIEEWKSIAQNSTELQARSRELLIELDKGFDKAIKEWWDLIEDSDTPPNIKNAALKNYTDAVSQRHDILQKAGLFDSMEEEKEVRETQEKVEQIRLLLQEVTVKYPQTKQYILTELAKIFNKTSSTGVVEVKVIDD